MNIFLFTCDFCGSPRDFEITDAEIHEHEKINFPCVKCGKTTVWSMCNEEEYNKPTYFLYDNAF